MSDRGVKSVWALTFGLALVVVPLLMWPGQMYDGGRMSLAARENDLSGFWLFAGRAGWEAQFGLLWIENLLADLLGVEFRALDLVVGVFAVALVAWETGRIAEGALSLPSHFRAATMLVTLAFPAWQVLASSIHTFHVLCVGVGLLGVRYFVTASSPARRATGFLLVIVGMQLSSSLVLLPVVALVWHNPTACRSRGVGRSKWVLLASITLFLGRRILFPNEEPYEDYNVFINPFTSFGVRDYAENVAGFFSLIISPLALVMLVGFALGGRTAVSSAVRSRTLIGPGLMTVGGVAPYVLVGKSANFRGFDEVVDWLFRHTFTMGPGLALLVSTLVFETSLGVRFSRRFVTIATAACVLVLAVPSLVGGLSKAGRRHFEIDLAAALLSASVDLPPGRVVVSGEGVPIPKFRPDEANWWSWDRLGRRDLWFEIGPEAVGRGVEIPESGDRSEQLDLVFEGADGSTCVTEVELDISGYGPLSTLKAGAGSHLSIRSMSTTC